MSAFHIANGDPHLNHWTSNESSSSNKMQSISLAGFDLIDAAVQDDRLLVLATSEPEEWTTEVPAAHILCSDLTKSKPSLTRLSGKGLNNDHGTGLIFEHPVRLLLAGSDHFIVVAERSIGALLDNSQERAKVQFQIAVFVQHSTDTSDLLQHLEEPRSADLGLEEYDLSVNSAQAFGTHVVAIVRWRQDEAMSKILRGRQGVPAFMDGWVTCEAIVWSWETGQIVGRVSLSPQGHLRPSVKLISDAELKINCSDSPNTAYLATFDGSKRPHHHSEASLSLVDHALKAALLADTSNDRASFTIWPAFSSKVLRPQSSSVTRNALTLDNPAIPIHLQRVHALSDHSAIYSASPEGNHILKPTYHRSSNAAERFFLMVFKPSRIVDLQENVDAQHHIYNLRLHGSHDYFSARDPSATPVPFLRQLDDSLVQVQQARPVIARSRSTSAAHSRNSSMSSMDDFASSGAMTSIATPATPLSPIDEDEQQKVLPIFFMPLQDEKVIKLLQQKQSWAGENRLVGYNAEASVMNVLRL